MTTTKMTLPTPSFVTALLERQLPPLKPVKLSDNHNPPHSSAIQSAIADACLHPLIEATLHLLNDDVFSAHFLLRKMQEDIWGKWLHGILHAIEGDVRNAKCWYRDVPKEILTLVYFDSISTSPHVLASHAMDLLSLALGASPEDCVTSTERSSLAKGDAYNIDDLKGVIANETIVVLEMQVRRARWIELKTLLEHLVELYEWSSWEGTKAYTKDSDEMKKKGRVLGEGWRKF
jgi:hypothetical protein